MRLFSQLTNGRNYRFVPCSVERWLDESAKGFDPCQLEQSAKSDIGLQFHLIVHYCVATDRCKIDLIVKQNGFYGSVIVE